VSARSLARLPAATSLGRAVLAVAELERSRAFYREVLGMVVHDEAAGRLVLGPAGGEPLLVLREQRGARPVPPEGRLGLFHLAFLLPDRASLGRFLRHALDLGARLGAADHLVSEALYLTDPDGLGLEVYADRPRHEWQWDGDELRMDTLALDGPALVAAAAGSPWRGLPSETLLGHVHLQVDDLAAAERFYRDGIGFVPTVRSFPGARFLAAGGYHHHLGLNAWAPRAERAGEGDARLLAWEVIVPDERDVAVVRARLASDDVDAVVDDRIDGVSTVDPWGVRVDVRTAGR
jgi:catechol 2,3-dioxygenase